MKNSHILATGIRRCYDEKGQKVDCRGTGQDAEMLPGNHWPEERFKRLDAQLVQDRATDLIWTKNSCPSDFPLTWQEGLQFVDEMNKQARYGRSDWRMPNRRELRSLIDHGEKKPALTGNHPFENIFLGWFWTSTTAAIATGYAWYVHLEGGRMFYGGKDSSYWVWPVCGTSATLTATGGRFCYNAEGERIPCDKNGQDGALRMGVSWPEPRFKRVATGVLDLLTGLVWHAAARLGEKTTTWQEALTTVQRYGDETGLPWRMPTINELESLVDASCHSPALPARNPFSDIQDEYWSSTTSSYETDWAYVLYLQKGAVGVGFKKNRDFSLWPVMSAKTDA
ncbi:MAG: Lcl C-terminal domain-containing protein [Desulforhopalus sp.]